MPTVARCLVVAEPPTALVCQDDQAAVKEAKELLDGHAIGGTDAPKGVQFSSWWEIHQDILEN
jgi:hypothetical protein